MKCYLTEAGNLSGLRIILDCIRIIMMKGQAALTRDCHICFGIPNNLHKDRITGAESILKYLMQIQYWQ